MSYSLYVHIPFCKKKCNYCDFPSYAGKESLIPDYIEALKGESGYYSSIYEKPRIKTVFVGGGTPTLLSEADILNLFDTLRSDFSILPDAEITFEANPGTVTKEKLKALTSCGVNRISLGAQTFNNNLLKKLGRIHLEHEIIEAYVMIREAGFRNINIDLIFALPGESIKDWYETIKKAVDLKPEHISTYNLQVEEGTPLYLDKMEGSLNLPDEDSELKMFRASLTYLAVNGYRHYEISNFARSGFECRHNITYWTLEDYIGIGLGAHSYINGIRIENTVDMDKYLSKIFKEIKSEHVNTNKENMSEMIFLGLRLIEGLDLKNFAGRFGVSFRELYSKELDELISDKLLEITDKNARLTKKGLFLANEVFKIFL
jgi:oxygen-independent coproporphyrinogen-3 oxidase